MTIIYLFFCVSMIQNIKLLYSKLKAISWALYTNKTKSNS